MLKFIIYKQNGMFGRKFFHRYKDFAFNVELVLDVENPYYSVKLSLSKQIMYWSARPKDKRMQYLFA